MIFPHFSPTPNSLNFMCILLLWHALGILLFKLNLNTILFCTIFVVFVCFIFLLTAFYDFDALEFSFCLFQMITFMAHCTLLNLGVLCFNFIAHLLAINEELMLKLHLKVQCSKLYFYSSLNMFHSLVLFSFGSWL